MGVVREVSDFLERIQERPHRRCRRPANHNRTSVTDCSVQVLYNHSLETGQFRDSGEYSICKRNERFTLLVEFDTVKYMGWFVQKLSG